MARGVAIGFPLFRPRTVSREKLHTLMPRRNNDEITALLMRTKALARYCFAIRFLLLFAKPAFHWCDEREKRRGSTCSGHRRLPLGQSTPSPLGEIDDLVKMGVNALGEWATGLHLFVVLLHKALKVLHRSPLGIVY